MYVPYECGCVSMSVLLSEKNFSVDILWMILLFAMAYEKAEHRLVCKTLYDMTWATFKAPIHFIISVCFVSSTVLLFIA